MDRYWAELEFCRREHTPANLDIRSVIPWRSRETRRRARAVRFIANYIQYPAIASLVRRSDVYHIFDHAHARLIYYLPRHSKKIVTVHDLAPLREPDLMTPAQVERFRRQIGALRHADLLLAVSEFTKNEVIEYLKGRAPRIEVLHNGVAIDRFAARVGLEIASEFSLPSGKPVVLSVGSDSARKNLSILPSVLSRVVRVAGPMTLLRIGSALPPAIRDPLLSIENLSLVECGHVSEDCLIDAYHRATVLFFPSTLEGFGLPILEAMAAGTPVVASNASCLQEVGGNACRYFRVYDLEDAASSLIEVLQSANARAEMIRAGHERARQMTWRHQFERLCDFYAALAAKQA